MAKTTKPMSDAQAIAKLEKLLESLDPDARQRVIDWANAKYGPKKESLTHAAPTTNPFTATQPVLVPYYIPTPMPARHPDLGPYPQFPGTTVICKNDPAPSHSYIAIESRSLNPSNETLVIGGPQRPSEGLYFRANN